MNTGKQTPTHVICRKVKREVQYSDTYEKINTFSHEKFRPFSPTENSRKLQFPYATNELFCYDPKKLYLNPNHDL